MVTNSTVVAPLKASGSRQVNDAAAVY